MKTLELEERTPLAHGTHVVSFGIEATEKGCSVWMVDDDHAQSPAMTLTLEQARELHKWLGERIKELGQ